MGGEGRREGEILRTRPDPPAGQPERVVLAGHGPRLLAELPREESSGRTREHVDLLQEPRLD